MDINTIPVLEDYQDSIEKSFEKIDKAIMSWLKAEESKKSIKSSLEQELSNIKATIDLMKSEIQNLEDEEKKDLWSKKRSQLKSKFETYSKMENLKNIKVKQEKADYRDVNAKVNLEELTSEQAVERGDLIIEVDGMIIGRIKRIVKEDSHTLINTNKELERERDALDSVGKDLKEINYSLDRAKNKITDMFKMYSKDKCIICLIVVILILIVTIIITSLFGGDNKNYFNVPHDIFLSNNITTNSAHYSFGSINFINLISLILLYLL